MKSQNLGNITSEVEYRSVFFDVPAQAQDNIYTVIAYLEWNGEPPDSPPCSGNTGCINAVNVQDPITYTCSGSGPDLVPEILGASSGQQVQVVLTEGEILVMFQLVKNIDTCYATGLFYNELSGVST